jgi:transposase
LGERFKAYIEQFLLPTLKLGDVIMDNLGSQKGQRCTGLFALSARGFCPAPYSPDLNPIEQVFAKLKTLLQNAAEGNVGAT